MNDGLTPDDLPQHEETHLPPDELHVDGDNPNEQNEETFSNLIDGIRSKGWVGGDIVANTGPLPGYNGDSEGLICDGEHRLRAAEELGMTEVPVKLVDFENDADRRYWRQHLNKTTGEHDETSDALEYERLLRSGLSEQVYDLASAANENIDEIIESVKTGGQVPEAPLDVGAGNQSATANTEPGDLFQLGDHVLLCADSTDPENVLAALGDDPADMVFTDPPFNVTGSSTGLGDDVTDHSLISPFFKDVADTISASTRLMGHVYVCCDWRTYPLIWETIGSQATPKNLIVWDKQNGGLGSNYMNQHELLFFGHNYEQDLVLDRDHSELPPVETITGETNIWEITREHDKDTADDEKGHFAQKPIALCERAIQNSSDYGDVVLDPFGGSGSTLIAAEKTGRSCVMLEADPVFCDTIRRRWERITGNDATLLDTPDPVEEHDPEAVGPGKATAEAADD